jgi:hypothetical protein
LVGLGLIEFLFECLKRVLQDFGRAFLARSLRHLDFFAAVHEQDLFLVFVGIVLDF